MSRLGQNLGWGAAVLLTGAVVLGLRQTGPANDLIVAGGFDETLPPNVTLRLRKVSIRGRAGGHPAWDLRADRVDSTRQQDSVEFIGNVRAHFLQGGRERAEVTAPQAAYRVKEKQVQASGGVMCRVLNGDAAKVRAANDLRIETPEVTWNIGARQIVCPGQVQVTQPGAQMRGTNLTVDLVTRDFRLQRVEGSIVIDDAEDVGQALGLLSPMK